MLFLSYAPERRQVQHLPGLDGALQRVQGPLPAPPPPLRRVLRPPAVLLPLSEGGGGFADLLLRRLQLQVDPGDGRGPLLQHHFEALVVVVLGSKVRLRQIGGFGQGPGVARGQEREVLCGRVCVMGGQNGMACDMVVGWTEAAAKEWNVSM